MAKRKPVIEMYWAWGIGSEQIEPKVNLRILGGNGEIVWHNTQGYKDRSAAFQAIVFLQTMFGPAPSGTYNIRGPGRKPK